MSINLTIDSTASSLALNDRPNGFRVTAFDPGNQPPETQWASSVDTEGARRAGSHPQNRTVTATVLIDKSTAAALQTAEQTLTRKIAKLNREGGELLLTLPSTSTITFDVEDAYLSRPFTPQTARGNIAEYNLTFVCRPYGRGAEQDLGDNTETTLPALIFTEASIPGDVPALGRLVVDNDSSTDQWWMTWGIESRYYSSSANAALFYEAEGRTLLSDSSTTVLGGDSASSSVRNTTLSTDYKAVLSTQATGGGAHLSHIGTFRVYARMTVTVGTGTVSAALEWSEGDFLRYTRNPAVSISTMQANSWVLADLGLVTLTPVTAGTQRWEGRIIAKTDTVGSDVGVDYLLLIPVAEGSGVASGVIRSFTPTSYSGEDHFTSTTAGNALNARVAPTGGTWATSGDATDLAFDDDTLNVAGEHIKRSAVSGSSGRLAILGTTNYANVQVEVSVYYTGGGGPSWTMDQGVIARWTDSSNYLRATFTRTTDSGGLNFTKTLQIVERVSGIETVLASATFPAGVGSSLAFWKVRLAVTANGQATASVSSAEISTGYEVGTVLATCEGFSSRLATGGTLATGEPGIFDRVLSANAATRYYDDFLVATNPVDAAAFANQSIEIRHDRARREDSGGTLWVKPTDYSGDYLLVPASGAEARTARMVVKFSRTDPSSLDNGIDDLSARLFVTPRYLAPPA